MVNLLSDEVLQELAELLKTTESDEKIVATVLISGNPGCFIAGADIHSFKKFKTVQDGILQSKFLQRELQGIENSKKPVVAAIQGSCLGGGLELALACHYRIAVQNKKTGLGLPEVLLGLLPGAGGTQRLPKLVGVSASLDMMITGRTVKTGEAKEMGLVDHIVDPVETEPGTESEERTAEQLEEIAVKIAADLASDTLKMSRVKPELSYYAHDKVFSKARAQVMSKAKGHHPAPLKILDVAQIGLAKGAIAGYDAEAKAFGELVQTSESQGLISLFHGQTQCKKNRFGSPKALPKNVGVLGAGLMGTGIAQVSAEKGFNVILKSTTEKGVTHSFDTVRNGLETAKSRQRITAAEQDNIMSKVKFQKDYKDFDQVDIVIESVYEDLSIKRRTMTEVEAHVPDHCIFATNTSGLSIATIAQACKRPDKVIGMHYFSPVDKMQLIEIIPTPDTSKETIATAVQVGLKQGKICIVINNRPGFYTTRILTFMTVEAIHLIQEGVDPKILDKLITSFGFPVGACKLIDEVGVDIFFYTFKNMRSIFGPRFCSGSNPILEELVMAGSLGRKSGKGFFIYEAGKRDRPFNPDAEFIIAKHKVEPKLPLEDEDVLMRMITRFVNEAVLCIEEQVLTNPLDGDIGAVFGVGFPAFTGGPFHFVDNYGAQNLVDKMKKYEAAYGSRFTPCQLLQDYASDPTKKFFAKN